LEVIADNPDKFDVVGIATGLIDDELRVGAARRNSHYVEFIGIIRNDFQSLRAD